MAIGAKINMSRKMRIPTKVANPNSILKTCAKCKVLARWILIFAVHGTNTNRHTIDWRPASRKYSGRN